MGFIGTIDINFHRYLVLAWSSNNSRPIKNNIRTCLSIIFVNIRVKPINLLNAFIKPSIEPTIAFFHGNESLLVEN